MIVDQARQQREVEIRKREEILQEKISVQSKQVIGNHRWQWLYNEIRKKKSIMRTGGRIRAKTLFWRTGI